MVTVRVIRAAFLLSFAISLASSSIAAPVQYALRGQILTADGKPAAGAIVEQLGVNHSSLTAAMADGEGRFALADGFERGVSLQARTADGREQAVYRVPAGSVRAQAAKDHTIRLSPAKVQSLHVTKDGIAVAEVDVVVSGSDYVIRGRTDAGGNAVVLIPAHRAPTSVAAFHPQLGVGGIYSRGATLDGESHKIELLPVAPHEIHVVDDDGKPVAGLEFSIGVGTGGKPDINWISLWALDAARVRTGDDGIAKVAWTPRDVRMVSPHIWSDAWKSDQLDPVKDGVTTQKLRQKHPVHGRLIAPEGVDPSGILISGCGFGSGNHIDLPVTRAAADGSFTLHVPAGHSYVVGVQDEQWAADPWTGDLRTDLPDEPVQVELKLYPATPLLVRVTRGPEHTPVANTFVSLNTERRFKYTNEQGERGNANGSIRGWLLTDDEGIARGAIARGESTISISDGNWTEERKVNATSAEPIDVQFYRPWLGRRRLTGQLLDGDKPYTPSSEAKLLAWTLVPNRMPLQHQPKLLEDGKFEVDFDAETAAVLLLDPANKLGGLIEVGPNDSQATLNLQATASYSGRLTDSAGKPVADSEVYLTPQQNWATSIVAAQTDSEGRFQFASVPSDVPLTARLRTDIFDSRQAYITRGDRTFKPEEKRENDRLSVRDNSGQQVKLPDPKLAESIDTAARDAKLNHMGVLVVLEGDDSVKLRDLTSRLLDGGETPDVYAYRVVSVSPERAKNEAGYIGEHQWPAAAEGEAIVLVLGDDGAVLEHLTITAATRDESLSEARHLLAKHRPPQRDAITLLAEAQQEAKASGRRLWVISGGPRCGPCFRLARWMDYQHALLDKDYVLVKVMGGMDKNAEVIQPLLPGSQSEGIPFHAIVEPDGKVLVTSKGPQGNIGMPSDLDGIQHLRKMLETTAQKLTPDDIAALEKSLLPH